MQQRFKLYAAIVSWFICSSSYNIALKSALQIRYSPVLALTIQNFAGAITAWLCAHQSSAVAQDSGSKLSSSVRPTLSVVVCAACFHLLGNVATTMSLRESSITLTHVVKAAEPLFTYILSVLLLRLKFSRTAFMDVVTIVFALQLVCPRKASDDHTSTSITALVPALASNLCFAARNVLVKMQLNMSANKQYFYFSSVGLLLCITYGVGCLFTQSYTTFHEDAFFLYGVAGLMHAFYNVSSMAVLQKLSPVLHSLLNSMKRAVVILCGAFVFRTQLTKMQLVGIGGIFASMHLHRTSHRSRPGCCTLLPRIFIFILMVRYVHQTGHCKLCDIAEVRPFDDNRIMVVGAFWMGENDLVKRMVDSIARSKQHVVYVWDTELYTPTRKFHHVERAHTQGSTMNWLQTRQLQFRVSQFRPMYFVTIAGGLSPKAADMQWLHKSGIVTVTWQLSDPDDFQHRGAHFAWMYDYVFTNSEKVVRDYTELWKSKHSLKVTGVAPAQMVFELPFAADELYHRPLGSDKSYDVIVVGEARADRIELVRLFAANGIRVGLYGSGWKSVPFSDGVTIHEQVNGYEQVYALNSGHIYLSFSRTMAGHFNVKVGIFEAAASGCCVLTSRQEKLFELWDKGDLLTYGSHTDALSITKSILSDETRLADCALRSRTRILRSHTWTVRWQQVLRQVSKRLTESRKSLLHSTGDTAATGLYIGFVNQANLGDELLVEAAHTFISQKLFEYGTRTVFVNYYAADACQLYKWDVNRFNFIVIGGGSLIWKTYLCVLDSADVEIPIFLWGTGFDDYMRETQKNPDLVSLIRDGNRTFSINSPEMKQTAELLSALGKRSHRVFGGLRGPHTQRFVAQHCPSCGIRVIGDAGIIVPELIRGKSRLDVYKLFNLDRSKRYIIANCAKMMMSNYGYGNNEQLSRVKFVKIMGEFMKRLNMHVILLPFWTGEIEYLKSIANDINKQILGQEHVSCESFEFVPDIAYFSSFMQEAYAVFGYRLHLQILSVAYKVPLISLAYSFKSMDFMDMVGLSEFVLRVDELSTSTFFAMFDKLEKQRYQILLKMQNAIESTLRSYEDEVDAFAQVVVQPKRSSQKSQLAWERSF